MKYDPSESVGDMFKTFPFSVHTKDDLLRENLAAAIASCAPHGTNTQELGRLRTVTPIVGYMVSSNPRVHRTTAMALQRLSEDSQNCITMHQVSLATSAAKS